MLSKQLESEILVFYFKENEIVNPKLVIKRNTIEIENLAFTSKVISFAIIAVVSISLFFKSADYIILAVPILGLTVYRLWQSFNSINKTIFDFDNQSITIYPKNIFDKKYIILFNEIDFFEDDYDFFEKSNDKTYKLKAILKDGKAYSLNEFMDMQDAKFVVDYFNKNIIQ